jgi:hypothetical protein
MSETPPATEPINPDLGEPTSLEVQRLHAGPIEEHIDPRDGFEPIPAWALLAFAGLLMWGGFYGGIFNGGFQAQVMDRPNAPVQPVVVAPGTLLGTPATTTASNR